MIITGYAWITRQSKRYTRPPALESEMSESTVWVMLL